MDNKSSDSNYFLNLHSRIVSSSVNGPGDRYVIWLQGCPHACVGCFNPETWSFKKQNMVSIFDLASDILSSGADGLTISGGEPFSQSSALLNLLKSLHDVDSNLINLSKGIICFTGNLIEELDFVSLDCLRYIDLLIDGRYVEQLRYPSGLAGSSNQRFHFSSIPGRGCDILNRDEIIFDQAVEVHTDSIDANLIRVTGFPSINRDFLRKNGLSIESEK
jgi:anaerobic ribonucleoside-triphosphate reductase activating protein